MKKIVMGVLVGASLLTTSALAQESGLYVGLDLSTSSNTFTLKNASTGATADFDDDSDGFKLKFGAAGSDGWRVQGYYQHETYDETIFDNKNDVLNEIGIEIIKGFEVTPEFSPFIQVGVGTGWMDVEGYSDNTMNSVSVKIGGGVMYKITPSFEAIAGVDFQARKWQDVQVGFTTIETTEGSTKLYIGANFHF